jgi:hypothetical protein
LHRFTTYIALFLLLVFSRAMVPDQLLLSLHNHGHTEHPHPGDQKNAHVDKKHSHCPVEDLFGAPYQGSVEAFSFTLSTILPEHKVRHTAGRAVVSHTAVQQRGPPALA